MICHPYRMVGTQLEESYGRWVTGEGLRYWSIHNIRVKCTDCGEDLTGDL